MNSKQLIDAFPDVYANFFGAHSLVISLPLIVNWCDDLAPNYGGVSIKQKIPSRFYVGVTRTHTKSFQCQQVIYRDAQEKQFISTSAFEYAPYFYDIVSLINEKYAFLCANGGYTLTVLSELGRGKGLGFDTLVTLAVSALCQRLAHKLDHEKIVKMNELPINEVINNSYLGIKDLLRESFEIDLLIHKKTFFSRKISALFDAYYPIVSFTEDNLAYGNFDKTDDAYKRFGYRLNELFPGLREIPYVSIDRGVIYSGKPVLYEQIMERSRVNTDVYKHMFQDLQTTFAGLFDGLLPIKKPRFYSAFFEDKHEEIPHTFGTMMGVISLEILYYMHRLYVKGYSDHDMRAFLDACDKTRYANHITRETSHSLILFLNKLLGNLSTHRNMVAVFPNDTMIMGGSVCFVMPSEGFRRDLFTSIEETKKDFGGMDLLYASRLDGGEHRGLVFEQDVEKGIFSTFLTHARYVVRTSTGETFIGDHDQCIHKFTGGILLDILHNKIYINGKKMTSDQLHSQSATIELLKTLLDHLGKDVSNKDLVMSSYSKNKNEMMGKIILPLLELIEQEMRVKLPLICKGSMYEFYVKLNVSTIPLAVLDKIV